MTTTFEQTINFGGYEFLATGPAATGNSLPFGLVIAGPPLGADQDYLHQIFLDSQNRQAFLDLIAKHGLVICKQVRTDDPRYRKVRGKSSSGKLSQAEYYHHDGCSCPTKPQVVEIRFPDQEITRQVATAIARFPDVIHAMLDVLPVRLKNLAEVVELQSSFSRTAETSGAQDAVVRNADSQSPVASWDQIQGRLTRLVRREMDAESCRGYFRDVDQAAGAYVEPWEMGESRLMLNDASNLANTMQHRRAYQSPRMANEQNGSLVKRWTAEET